MIHVFINVLVQGASAVRYLDLTSPSEAMDVLKEIGVDPYGIQAMVPKMCTLNVVVRGIECKVANIMKQEMLSIGGDVAVSRGTVACSIDRTDAVIIGTNKQMRRFAEKISLQPFGLQRLSENLQTVMRNIERQDFIIKTPERTLTLGGHTAIMGILNMTPDSFSDGSRFNNLKEAVACVEQMEEDGADIIDIGGESTRPGADPVTVEEELARVIPIIREVKRRVRIPISIDTTKAEVAHQAINEGAEIVNDISAMQFDARMSSVIAREGVPIALMHMRGIPKTMQEGDIAYRLFMDDIIDFLQNRIHVARTAGIREENIIVDPGFGFGKTMEHNLQLLRHLNELKALGRPILVGTSRKKFIGSITGGEPQERLDGTAATVAASIMNGALIVRVHDVKFMKNVARMTDAIVRVPG